MGSLPEGFYRDIKLPLHRKFIASASLVILAILYFLLKYFDLENQLWTISSQVLHHLSSRFSHSALGQDSQFSSLLLIGACIIYIPMLLVQEKITRNWIYKLLYSIRTVLSVIYCISDLSDLGSFTVFNIFEHILLISTCTLEHSRGQHPAVIPCIYLLLSLSSKIPFLQSVIYMEKHSYEQLLSTECYNFWTVVKIFIFIFFFICDTLIPTRWLSVVNYQSSSRSKILPLFGCNLFSRASFTWMIPQFIQSSRQGVTLDDLFCYIPGEESQDLFNGVTTWIKSQNKRLNVWFVSVSKQTLLLLAVIKPFIITVIASQLLRLFGIAFGILNIYTLRAFLTYLERDDSDRYWGLVLSLRFFITQLGVLLFQTYHLSITYYVSAKCRGVINVLVMEKFLKLSAADRGKVDSDVTSYVTVDAQRAAAIICQCNVGLETLVFGPAMIYIMWGAFGPPSLCGLLVAILFIYFCNVFLQRKMNAYTKGERDAKSERLSIIDNIIHGIKTLKLNRWEDFFEKKIFDVRDRELSFLRSNYYVSCCQNVLFKTSTHLVVICTLVAYVLLSSNTVVSSDKIFMSYLVADGFCKWSLFLPYMVIYYLQGKISIQRLLKFLLTPVPGDQAENHVTGDNISYISKHAQSNGISLKDRQVHSNISKDVYPLIVENMFCSWDNTRSIISGVDLRIQSGELVAVVGPVGCGKTSLLAALLGEMNIQQGHASLKGSIGYAPQKPWIMQTSIRENIVFGKPYHKGMYEQISRACGLNPDLAGFPHGDLTEVGERGSTLSGGQKHRVSLARAVYCDADVYLIDDPLSAVDCHVATHIFQEVIGPKGLLRNKTRILVTHNLQVLPSMDKIVVMEEGKILEIGKYSDLKISNESLLQKMERKDEKSNDESSEVGNDQILKRGIGEEMKLMKDELIERDKISCRTLVTYARAFGVKTLMTLLASSILMAFVTVGVNMVVSRWGSLHKDTTKGSTNTSFNLVLAYVGFGLLLALAASGQAFSIVIGSLQASKALHEGLLSRILRAKLAFYHTTPLGRITNWFTRDMEIIDNEIKTFMFYLGWCVPTLLAAISLALFAVPYLILAILPIAWMTLKMQRVYSKYIREVRRLDGVSRSPVFSFFHQTVDGIMSIRAYRRQADFFTKFCTLVDRSTLPTWHLAMAKGLMFCTCRAICSILYLGVCVVCVLYHGQTDFGVTTALIIISLQVFQTMMTFTQHTAELECTLVSVERVTGESDQQAEMHLVDAPLKSPTGNKPMRDSEGGEIQFQNYFTKYRPELEYVLKDLTFVIKQKEKIGVVGRTGAGKSTLSLVLVRLLEASKGKILIDGTNIADMPLSQLRSKVMVINQEPMLFKGTVRDNLDPTNKFTDHDIWNVLQKVFMKDYIRSANGQGNGLQWECKSEGEKLSIGQRQLLCLARALLHKCQILVLDESTAAVDVNTDRLVQKMLRTHLNHCTLITIAHRINTIIDYDRVMVLENGYVMEFDTPNSLLSKSSSKFYSLAREAGLV